MWLIDKLALIPVTIMWAMSSSTTITFYIMYKYTLWKEGRNEMVA